MRNTEWNGIWFFGLAGAGKTYASKISHKLISNAFIIDGDTVRDFVSKDLGYSLLDRKIQLRRVLGIANIAIDNRKYPVISTVSMNREIQDQCEKLKIRLVEVCRPEEQRHAVRNIYNNGVNVVGLDIQAEKIDCLKIWNAGTGEFQDHVTQLFE